LLDSAIGKMKDDARDFEDIINLDNACSREIYLYDILVGSGSSIDSQIRFWNKYDEKHKIPVEKRQPIKIYIDSNGGSLTDTLTIIDSIRMSKTPVWTICIGCAYSGGFFSFISGKKRIAYPHASFLFHEGSIQTGGTSGQFENQTQFYKKQLEQLKEIVLENTNISKDEYRDIRKDDIWYDVKEGIEKGFIDEVAKGLI
jgi:ATP-dependent Clp protease protease subunit